MTTILKRWCISLSAANKRSNLKSIFILSLLLSRAAIAQEALPILPSLPTEISQKNPGQYQVGDRIQLNVRIPLELSQELATVQLKNSDPKNALDSQGWYLDPSPQIINGNLRFIVSPIKSGKLALPELLVLKDDTHPVAKTSVVNIEVAELTPNPSAPPNLLEPVALSLPTRFVLMGIAFLLALAGLAFYVYKKYFADRKKTEAVNQIKVPPTPDHVIALRDLNLLYEQYPHSKENLKPIAFGVSQILKHFFSARFKIDASESTTEEMMKLLRQESIPAQDLKKIITLFQNLDLIKFTELQYHQHFQKSDYQEFKDQAKSLIDDWALKGGDQQ